MNALQYNRNQNYAPDVIARIQRTVGACTDGLWGRRTIAQIRDWQKNQGITPDGKIGPGTMKRFEALWAEDETPSEDEDLDDVTTGGEPLEGEDDDEGDLDGDTLLVNAIGEGFNYFDGTKDIGLGDKGEDVLALQNDLFAFGFTNDPPKPRLGDAMVKAVIAFQRAALTQHRIAGYQCVEVPLTFEMGKEGVVDGNTCAEIRLWKHRGYSHRAPGANFIERRVRVKKLGTLPKSSNLLREVPGTGGKPRRLHRLAAAALLDMIVACEADIGVELRVQSGWRRHRWSSRQQYEKTMIEKYGSVKEGSKWMGYASAHETGLAADFGTGGLEAKKATIAKQKKTPAYAWLVANAYRFGFAPYMREPWHWEFPLSVRAWTSGLSDWRLSDEVDGD